MLGLVVIPVTQMAACMSLLKILLPGLFALASAKEVCGKEQTSQYFCGEKTSVFKGGLFPLSLLALQKGENGSNQVNRRVCLQGEEGWDSPG